MCWCKIIGSGDDLTEPVVSNCVVDESFEEAAISWEEAVTGDLVVGSSWEEGTGGLEVGRGWGEATGGLGEATGGGKRLGGREWRNWGGCRQ